VTEVDPRDHAGLLEVLRRARSLGFTGPGEPEEHIDHAMRFVDLAREMIAKPLHGGETPLRSPDGSPTATRIRIPRGIDLGTGGGVPGLVLAVALPWVHWVLVDSMPRRTTILDEAVAQMGMQDRVTVWCGRAEDLGRDPGVRQTADLVVARSFGPPAATAECAAPLLRSGGSLLVSEPPDSEGERWPRQSLEELGIEPVGVNRGVMVLAKVAETPDRFPRRVGIPAKRPLF
jgi:16S rRNA (guanine527-N7)-methyltransferase